MDTASALLRILPELPRPLIDRLAGVSGVQHISKGSLLFREGERAHFIYGLVAGRAALSSGPQGEQTIADFIDAGDVVLIPPCLLDLPYMVTARAVTDLQVVMIPAGDFRRLAESELPLAITVSRIVARHWRLLLRQLTQAKTYDVDSRLTQYLLDHAGTRTGAARFALQGTKQELAAHLGVTPATLSRSLKRLRRMGVRTSRKEFQIENVARLGAILKAPHQAHRAAPLK